MRILRADGYRRMRWKNGGGETAEIAVYPEDAALNGFGWRVSMATVASDGPFSAFPEVDRTLTVLDGEGIVLEVEGSGKTILTPVDAPYSFRGDVATSGRLVGGPIIDLNVMTRRGLYGHRVTRHAVGGTARVTCAAPVAMLLCAAPCLRVSVDGSGELLARHDAIILTEERALVDVEGQGDLFLVEIEPSA